jgi:phytanoyl-CoA dioxygenase PhyH
MTASPSTQHARQVLGRAGQVARRNLRRIVDESGSRSASRRPSQPVLPPTAALRDNGFTVFRGLFPPEECARLARRLKAEAGIKESVKYTKVDATNSFPTAREILLEGRIVDAVRSALGAQPRYLQVGDLHYLHDTAGWHRDSVHRAHDSSDAPDWRSTAAPFGVVKAILYLESDNAAMGIMAGSHRSPIEMDHEHVKAVEAAGGQLVVDARDEPNRRLTDEQKRIPLAWKAEAGDVLVFDERMYHAGRRVDAGAVTANREAAKFTLSLVFGLDNEHSERMYSYFRYVRRELSYRDLSAGFADELAARDLVLSRGWTDFYAEHPEDLRHAYLPDPSRLQQLLDEYAAGAT